MKIVRKYLTNPIFRSLRVRGKLVKLSLKGNDLYSYKIISPTLDLKVGNDRIRLELSTDTGRIQQVFCQLDGEEFTFEKLATFADLIALLDSLSIKSYWKQQETVFLLYTFLRFCISIITVERIRTIIREGTQEEFQELLEKQLKCTTLFVHLLESSQIRFSPYVVNARAKSLLLLGLDPRKKYEKKDLKMSGREWLRLTHPDTELGNEELFKRVNEAVTYLTK
ncbi:hypothetical protein GGQ92_001621 [Gracilibacillus halotolerans]|uniref:J domain-containing protein n=1 Tax=Gracilibacillus halotolerans TaxID=74386 RepID=A0A841RLL7_9BACI|nr:hypothetical protein [Gracilibacillus halotolerans]MBB6512832.1 hypothetical protein [Gracilibacillus halotolerans]